MNSLSATQKSVPLKNFVPVRLMVKSIASVPPWSALILSRSLLGVTSYSQANHITMVTKIANNNRIILSESPAATLCSACSAFHRHFHAGLHAGSLQ